LQLKSEIINFKSQLGFGGASLTSMRSYANVKDLLNTAYSLGIKHYDTSDLYGKGYSELIYGHFLKDKRKDITITTKFGLGSPFYANQLPVSLLLPLNYQLKTIKNAIKKPQLINDTHYTPVAFRHIDKPYVEACLKASLNRLKTDYIDYYLLHEGLPNFLTEAAFAYLLDRKKQGQIRYIGLATNVLDIKALDTEGVENWDILQYEGYDKNDVLSIKNKFPNKLHFHHSCLKNRTDLVVNNVLEQDKIGYMLAQSILNNPDGKVVFSTRNTQYLNANINAIKRFV
jgi:aryl-alcohol dehydrogenase-like predicted oxidoreductase